MLYFLLVWLYYIFLWLTTVLDPIKCMIYSAAVSSLPCTFASFGTMMEGLCWKKVQRELTNFVLSRVEPNWVITGRLEGSHFFFSSGAGGELAFLPYVMLYLLMYISNQCQLAKGTTKLSYLEVLIVLSTADFRVGNFLKCLWSRKEIPDSLLLVPISDFA